jgi:hypothetical protein
MKIKETEIWVELCKLDLITRGTMIERFASKIETMFDCKIIDRPFTELGDVTNPALSVRDNIMNVCYLKEFVPNIKES